MPDACGPGEHGECDGDGIWTGSVIAHDGGFHFFYTGYNRQSASPQTICKAASTDLLTWEKAPGNPLITPDPRWHETVDWRDPFVFRDAGTGAFCHAFTETGKFVVALEHANRVAANFCASPGTRSCMHG